MPWRSSVETHQRCRGGPCRVDLTGADRERGAGRYGLKEDRAGIVGEAGGDIASDTDVDRAGHEGELVGVAGRDAENLPQRGLKPPLEIDERICGAHSRSAAGWC